MAHGVEVRVGVSVGVVVEVAVGVGVRVGVGAGVGVADDAIAKSWVVTLSEVTITPVVVLSRYPVTLAVTLYVPGPRLML